jgi:tRNA threonylcarbamoyladenosine biosynthesis protein TsaB
MKVVGIDTSTASGSVGLTEDDEVIAEHFLKTPVTHSERLLDSIELVLREARWTMEDVEGWAISAGPGSFTGLRIGVSTVKGLAFATEKPVVRVPTLDALASQISATPYLICPILDARKREVYTAFYRYEEDLSLGRRSAYQAVGPDDLVKRIGERTIFIGDGVKTYGNFLRRSLPSFAVFPPSDLNVLHGGRVAQWGLGPLRRKEHSDLSAFVPIYIRPSEAEMKWQGKPVI